jgi:hypothetical protein
MVPPEATPDVPDTLYHYCGVGSFYAILTSKKIWVSHARFMNDYSEQTWFLEKARKRLAELSKGEDKPFIEPLIKHFDEMGSTPYVCCFSREGDLLSQWRAYADDGAGFALGFETKSLEEIGRTYLPTDNTQLWEVIYEDEDQTRHLDHYIQKYLQAVKVDGRPTDPGRTALFAIWILAAICKNRGFREEQEFRFVGMVPHHPSSRYEDSRSRGPALETQFRVTERGVVPFFPLPFPEGAVKEIVLGPDNHARKYDEALKAFLLASGYDVGGIKISLSETTYHSNRTSKDPTHQIWVI